jgi:hypothetical protein
MDKKHFFDKKINLVIIVLNLLLLVQVAGIYLLFISFSNLIPFMGGEPTSAELNPMYFLIFLSILNLFAYFIKNNKLIYFLILMNVIGGIVDFLYFKSLFDDNSKIFILIILAINSIYFTGKVLSKKTTIIIAIIIATFTIAGTIYAIRFQIMSSKIIHNEISDCDYTESQLSKDKCYQEVAKRKQDLSICNKIQSQAEKVVCYDHFVISKQSLSLCDQISDESNDKAFVSSCYSDFAVKTKDSSICEKIQDQWNKDVCYSQLVEVDPDIKSCKKINDDWRRDLCYRNVARDTNNLSICRNIQNEEIRSVCLALKIK